MATKAARRFRPRWMPTLAAVLLVPLFIAAGQSQAEVRRVLIDARAAQSDAADILSSITADAGIQSIDRPETSPIVAAVKKLSGKE